MQVGLAQAFCSPLLVCILGSGLTFLFGGKGLCFIYETENASEPCLKKEKIKRTVFGFFGLLRLGEPFYTLLCPGEAV